MADMRRLRVGATQPLLTFIAVVCVVTSPAFALSSKDFKYLYDLAAHTNEWMVASLDNDFEDVSSSLQVRQVSMQAYHNLALGLKASSSNQFISKSLDKFTGDGFPTLYSSSSETDNNQMQFVLYGMGAAVNQFKSKLDISGLKDSLVEVTDALVKDTHGGKLLPDYTNVYAMRIAGLISLGNALSHASAKSAGTDSLATFNDRVANSGFREYDSPPYSIITYSALLVAHNSATNTTEKNILKNLLDYYTLLLVTKSLGGRMAGAISRNYDIMLGDGDIMCLYYMLGLRTKMPLEQPGFQPAYLVMFSADVSNGYFPSASAAKTYLNQERVVETFSSQMAENNNNNYKFNYDTYTYIHPAAELSVGTASAFFGVNDRPLGATLTADPTIPQLSLFLTVKDDIAGKNTDHMTYSIATVQDKGSVLFLANLAPHFASSSSEVAYVASNIVLPFQASGTKMDVLFNGDLINAKDSKPFDVSRGGVLQLRTPGAVLLLRFLYADGIGGYKATAKFVYSKPDGQPAARLVVYHYAGEKRSFSGTKQVKVALAMHAQAVSSQSEEDDVFKAFSQLEVSSKTNGNNWGIVAKFPSGVTLATGIDLSVLTLPSQQSVFLYRCINNQDVTSKLFTVTLMDKADQPIDVHASFNKPRLTLPGPPGASYKCGSGIGGSDLSLWEVGDRLPSDRRLSSSEATVKRNSQPSVTPSISLTPTASLSVGASVPSSTTSPSSSLSSSEVPTPDVSADPSSDVSASPISRDTSQALSVKCSWTLGSFLILVALLVLA